MRAEPSVMARSGAGHAVATKRVIILMARAVGEAMMKISSIGMSLPEKLLSGESIYLSQRQRMKVWFEQVFTPACIKAFVAGFNRGSQGIL